MVRSKAASACQSSLPSTKFSISILESPQYKMFRVLHLYSTSQRRRPSRYLDFHAVGGNFRKILKVQFSFTCNYASIILCTIHLFKLYYLIVSCPIITSLQHFLFYFILQDLCCIYSIYLKLSYFQYATSYFKVINSTILSLLL